MKKIILFLLILSGSVQMLTAQNYNEDLINLTNFLVRMYKSAPFEGVRAVNDYDNYYLLVVVSTPQNSNVNVMNRIASAKAMSTANEYYNGSNVTSTTVIHTSGKSDKTSDPEISENIRIHSAGYVRALQQMTNFKGSDGRQVFFFYKKLDMNNNKQNQSNETSN